MLLDEIGAMRERIPYDRLCVCVCLDEYQRCGERQTTVAQSFEGEIMEL